MGERYEVARKTSCGSYASTSVGPGESMNRTYFGAVWSPRLCLRFWKLDVCFAAGSRAHPVRFQVAARRCFWSVSCRDELQ